MRILNFGSLNVDYVYRVDRFLLPGETKLSKSRRIHAGGKGLNQSIALARAGAHVHHAGVIGNGDSKLLIETLENSGVNTEYLVTSSEPGGHTIIQVDDSGQNTILLYGGTNRSLTKDYIDEVLQHFTSNDIVLLQNEVNLAEYIIEKSFEYGMRVAFNAAPIDSTVKSFPLEKLSWLIVNEVEGSELTGLEKSDDILNCLNSKYPNTAILLTLGEHGCRYLYNNCDLSVPAFHVSQIIDTTGAGDTFTGYFLHNVAQGINEKRALEIASAASALAIQKNGAAESIPWANEIKEDQL